MNLYSIVYDTLYRKGANDFVCHLAVFLGSPGFLSKFDAWPSMINRYKRTDLLVLSYNCIYLISITGSREKH